MSWKSAAEQLPQRIESRDPQAFQLFASIFGPVFRRHFLRLGFPPFEAEDHALNLTVDIPMRVLEGKFEARPGVSFSAWVLKSMRNATVDSLRKRNRSPQVVPLKQDFAPSDTAGPEDDETELVLAVREAICGLPAISREIIELRHLRGEEDFDAIAARLGIRTVTARVRHSRAISQLADALLNEPALRKILGRTKQIL